MHNWQGRLKLGGGGVFQDKCEAKSDLASFWMYNEMTRIRILCKNWNSDSG